MTLSQIFWLVFSLVSTTGTVSELLNCSVTKQPDGSFLYQLSRPPSSGRCQTGWEDVNKTAFSQGSTSYQDHVQNLTNQSITVKACQDYMHYTEDCIEGFQEAHCRVNCSLLMVEGRQPLTVNSTLTCIFESWCPDQLQVGLIIGVPLLIVAVVVVVTLSLKKSSKCRRGGSANEETSYTQVHKQTKRRGSEQKLQDSIV